MLKSTFLRNPDKTAEVVASRTTSIIPTDIDNPLPSNELTGNEEEESMDEINQEIDELFSDIPKGSPP